MSDLTWNKTDDSHYTATTISGAPYTASITATSGTPPAARTWTVTVLGPSSETLMTGFAATLAQARAVAQVAICRDEGRDRPFDEYTGRA